MTYIILLQQGRLLPDLQTRSPFIFELEMDYAVPGIYDKQSTFAIKYDAPWSSELVGDDTIVPVVCCDRGRI